MRKKGSLTVFYAMLLSVILLFVVTIVTDSKRYVVLNELNLAAEAAIKSCFAEYNRRLFERYHLLYLDPSYKGEVNSSDQIKSHFSAYFSGNIHESDNSPTIDEVELWGEECACDDEWSDLDRQIHEYISYCYGNNVNDYLYYARDMFGNKYEPRIDVSRTGEIEYLIFGEDSDELNLQKAVEEYFDSSGNEFAAESEYKEFLYSRLEQTEAATLRSRVIELIEEDIRNNGSPGFRMDKCVRAISVHAKVTGANGYEQNITKSYGYEIQG